MFKFGQIEVPSKDFSNKRQITDVFTIDVNKVVLSVYHCLSRRLRIYLAMACHNPSRTPLTHYHLMFLRYRSEWFSIETSGMRLSCSYLKN